MSLVNYSPVNAPVTVTLARDGCALLNCTNSNGCANGVCQCKNFAVGTFAYGFAGPECRDLVCPGQPACSARGYCTQVNSSSNAVINPPPLSGTPVAVSPRVRGCRLS